MALRVKKGLNFPYFLQQFLWLFVIKAERATASEARLDIPDFYVPGRLLMISDMAKPMSVKFSGAVTSGTYLISARVTTLSALRTVALRHIYLICTFSFH